MMSGLSLRGASEFLEREIRLEQKPWGPMLWECDALAGESGVKRSEEFYAIEFTGRNTSYTNADTWYPSWASDGNMYSPFTDGVSGVWSKSRSGGGANAVTGQAKISGENPLDLRVESLGVFPGSALPYGGRYPGGSLVYDGIWYYGSYCLDASPNGYNWGTLGPFVGFRISKDYGKTWTDCPHTAASPLFGESAKEGGVVKLGALHFVDFGKNMEHSPDGKAYLVCHGASKDDPKPRPANNSWVSGDEIYLIRVAPSIENMNDKSAYEFYCGRDANGKALWSKDFSKIKPIFEWNNHCGCVTITYNPFLKKYFMCITDGWPTVRQMSTYLLESDNVYGDWKMVSYMKNFGEQAYFVNIPTKFIDGVNPRKMWLCYSGNFAPYPELGTNPPGGRYGMVLQEFRLLSKSQYESYPREKYAEALDKKIELWRKLNPLTSEKNLARKADIEVSSTYAGYDKNALRDGVAAGYPQYPKHEWASNKEKVGAWVRYSWENEVKVGKIWLFDRPHHSENVKAVSIKFSDGTEFKTGELPNIEGRGLELSFPARKVNWIEFKIVEVGRSANCGFSEIAVF